METKIKVQTNFLINNIENQAKIQTNQEENDLLQNFCFCFEGFYRYKCLIFNCIGLLIFS
jgi:hypothetical protein